jgi:hypothetical protein
VDLLLYKEGFVKNKRMSKRPPIAAAMAQPSPKVYKPPALLP